MARFTSIVRTVALTALCLSATPAQGGEAPTLGAPTVSINGPVAGAGFNLQEDTGLLPEYTVRLVLSPGIETLRDEVQRAVDEVVGITGLTVTVAPGTIVERPRTQGEILVRVSPYSPCLDDGPKPHWAGCATSTKDFGGPRPDVRYQLSADVWINVHELGLEDREHVVFHEMGHAFGLSHYNQIFEGQVQVMHPSNHAQTSYQSGDRNGLIYQRDRGAL